jgi:pyruvate formate-lyase activating enzyme-like uncharacterized protein
MQSRRRKKVINELNEETLATLSNPVFRSYAERYVHIHQQFMDQVRQSGIEIESSDLDGHYSERLAALHKKGAVVRNDSKSIYAGRISSACQACQKGVDSTTFFISLKCHRDCFYCFNPNQEGYEYFRSYTRDTEAELQALRASGEPVRHLALTGGEPLLHKEEAIRFFQQARRDFPGVYTRLYTCGDHVERQTLQALKDADLDEIRFSIRLQDLEKGKRHTYKQIALAREFIPHVMVEMPVLPGTLTEMKEILKKLAGLGIFGINLLELCYPLHNAGEFQRRGYQVKAKPFRVLYNYWYAGGLPVAGSEMECLDLVEFALDEHLELGVHYCSLENKHTGQIYQQNSAHPKPRNMFFSQSDYFLKSAKVFGDDIAPVLQHFRKVGVNTYDINKEHNYLEFHIGQIKSLKKLNVEIGISTNVLEDRNGERFVRELKVESTTPQTFRQTTDI